MGCRVKPSPARSGGLRVSGLTASNPYLRLRQSFTYIYLEMPIQTRIVPPPGNSGARGKILNVMERKMKLKILSLSALVILALALCLSVTTTPASPKTLAAAAGPAAIPHPAAAPAALPEPHPEIREAIASLRMARNHLEHAAHDFGGHRVEAIKAIDESLHQLQDCLKFDKD